MREWEKPGKGGEREKGKEGKEGETGKGGEREKGEEGETARFSISCHFSEPDDCAVYQDCVICNKSSSPVYVHVYVKCLGVETFRRNRTGSRGRGKKSGWKEGGRDREKRK